MSFNVGDSVVKPGLGICKIKAVRKMQVEGSNQSFYVLQSGDVKVMVPFSFAHSGGLRALVDGGTIEKIFQYFIEPIRVPDNEFESSDQYSIEIEKAKATLKNRDPQALAELIKPLFYKKKMVELDKAETDIFQNASQHLADEIAHVEHTTRQKIAVRIRTTLTEGRKSRKSHFSKNA